MDMKTIEIDNYTLSLDVTDYNPTMNLVFWLRHYEKKINGKIYIITFRKLDSTIYNNFTGEKFIWVDQIEKTFDCINKYINKLEQYDGIIIVGTERLTSYNNCKSIAETIVGGVASKIHAIHEENWSDLVKEINECYTVNSKNISGIVFIFSINKKTAELLLNELKDSDKMSIIQTQSSKTLNNLMDEVLEEIKLMSIDDSLKHVEKYSDDLDEVSIEIFKAIAYFNNGNISKCISMLHEQYHALTNEMKEFLADLYLINKEEVEGQKIFEEIYEYDNQLKGIYELGLRAYSKESERYREILDNAIKYEPNNWGVIECYASWLSDKKKYNEAAREFRRLPGSYYELIARINDLLFKKETNANTIKAYVYSIVETNPELKNEAVLRLGLFCIDEGSFYNAYNILQDANLLKCDSKSEKIIEKKLDILSDTAVASKALRKLHPFSKEDDAKLLIKERCKALYESVYYFSYKKNGYYYWRGFLNCQQNDVWNQYIFEMLIDDLNKLQGIDIEGLLKKSYIYNLKLSVEKSNIKAAIYTLRKSNCGEMPYDQFKIDRETIVKGCCIKGELEGTILERVWIKYYVSIGASILNQNPQDANNYSLSIPEYQENVCDEEKDLVTALFLMSWGNAQFRIGNKIEGIVCISVAIQKLVKCEEITPFLEEGVNVISRYLSEFFQSVNVTEKNVIKRFLSKVLKYNDTAKAVGAGFDLDSHDLMYEYEKRLKEKKHDGNWLIDFSNLLNLYIKENYKDKAVNLLKSSYQEAKKLLVYRKDVAVNLLYSWAEILISCEPTSTNIIKALEIIEDAMKENEERRNVFHQEERAALACTTDKILRKYLELGGMLYTCKDIDETIKEKIYKGILYSASLCIPLSVIEEKEYNRLKLITDKLDKKNDRLQSLKNEYFAMLKNNCATQDNVQILGREIEELTNNLKENHPYYKALEKFKGTDWKEIQNAIAENDVIYQYIITQMTVVSILVNKTDIYIKTKICDTEYNAIRGLKKYAHLIETADVNDKTITNYTKYITELIADQLLEYVMNNKTRRVYLIPDTINSSFPIEASYYKREYLIDKVDEIINFIDYRAVLRYIESKMDNYKIINRLFGKPTDKSISYIKRWLQTKIADDFLVINRQDDKYWDIIEQCEKENINILAVYGHGVPDPGISSVQGAKNIEGLQSMIEIGDLIKGIKVNNLIVISCLSGTSNDQNPEISSGIWKSIFEQFVGNIIVCKWSVPTKETIELVDYMYKSIFTEKIALSKALILAQRHIKEKAKNEICWAGVEFWVN